MVTIDVSILKVYTAIMIIILHYELQCYENPMKMSLKTKESIFQGPEYRYFIFMAYFSGLEVSIKSW